MYNIFYLLFVNKMSDTDQFIFHPVDTQNQQGVVDHIQKHYKKYLFGLGTTSIVVISFVLWIFFWITTTREKSHADFQENTGSIFSGTVFDQMDVLLHQRHQIFHDNKNNYMVWSGTVEKADNVFHIVDNAFHSATGVEEKFLQIQRLNAILDQQDKIFILPQNKTGTQNAVLQQLNQILHKKPATTIK